MWSFVSGFEGLFAHGFLALWFGSSQKAGKRLLLSFIVSHI